MLAATYSGGPSVQVSGWVAILIIIAGICTAAVVTWRVLYPLLRTTVALLEQMDFFRHAEAKHDTLAARVDNHEGRISALEHARK